MKREFYIVLSVLTIIVGISCSNTRSYTDMLNDQQKVIDRFRDENKWIILSEYPTDRLMKSNEFLDVNGIYINVIDSGRGDKFEYGDVFYCRYKAHFLMGDSISYDYFETGTYPLELRYGSNLASSNEPFLCDGLAMPLTFLRDSAEVKLLIPFQYGSYSYAQQYGYPAYFERVRYLKKK